MNRCTSFLVVFAFILAPASVVAQQKGGDFVFQPETVEKSGPPSKTLQKALKLYESRDYYSASIELHKVIEGETGDSPANRQRAEFWMGKTLYHLGFYSASLSYFDRIVQKGDAHRYYNATLKWLASLSRQLPESAGILKKIGKYQRAQLEQPALEKVRDELYYLLGRWHYSQGNFKDAISLFGSVPITSDFFAKAKFMEGITHVRMYKGRPASEAFKVLLRQAREAPSTKDISRFEELAILSLARVFYSTRQFDLSVKYYDQLPQESPHWLASLFESSWANFQRNNFSKALGNIHTLNAPYFENQFFPESLILRAVIYFNNCLYDRSAEAISEFNSKYPPLKGQMDAILRQYKDPTEFYEYTLKIKNSTAGLSEEVGRLARSALGDKTLVKTFDYVEELDRELKQVQGADPAWKATAIAGVVLQDLTLQKSLAQNEAGQVAQRRIKRVSKEIQELIKQAIKVEYETINGQKNKLEASLRNEQVVPANVADQTNIQPDDEHLFWPFDGQYWKDELGYYRFKIRSQCSR
jgi:tetratricopeptide (TPR) repeat protein